MHEHGLISTWAFEVLAEEGREAGEILLGEEKWRAEWSLFSFSAGTKSIVDRERTRQAHELREIGKGYMKRGKNLYYR